MKKRILITDDHTIVRRGVVSLLKEYFPFAELIEADSLQSSLDTLNAGKVDLIILDLNLPDANAENLVKKIRTEFSKLPIIIFFLTKIGLVTPEFLRKYRKYTLVVVLIVAAVITPPDVLSQIIVTIPIMILYEASILISVLVVKNQEKEKLKA